MKKRNSLFIVVAAALATQSAFAGEVLRMKTGSIRLQDHTDTLVLQPFTSSKHDTAERYFVIQFENSITEEIKEELRARGLAIGAYLPEDALIVKGDGEAVGLAGMTISGVRAVAPFASEWKISGAFNELKIDSNTQRELVHIRTMDGASTTAVERSLRAIPGLRLESTGYRSIVAEVEVGQVAGVAAIEGVEWVEPLPIIQTFEYRIASEETRRDEPAPPALTGYESGTRVMGFETAWERGFFGDGQVVAMADTGLDSGNVSSIHRDFNGPLMKGYAMAAILPMSWADPHGHGTHVAGSIVGTGSASRDGSLKGGAPRAKLVAEGMWSDLFRNILVNTDFNELMGKPYQDGARVHSNSWGNPRDLGAYDAMAAAADEFMWQNPEMLLVFAAGNSGEDGNKDGRIDEGSVSSPGTAKNVLTVGASENLLAEGGIQKPHGELNGGDQKWGAEPLKSDKLSDDPNGLAAFSSRGPTRDGRIKPEVVAPGTNIISVRSQHPDAGLLWGAYSQDYVYAGGTSMATPLTAGGAAVLREYFVKEFGIASPTAALVKAGLMHTAKDLFPGQYGTGPKQELPTKRPNVHEGYGRVDMVKATAMAGAKVIDSREGVAAGEQFSITVNARRGATVRATLVYTDAPGSVSAAKALVNDLDLVVVDPNGRRTEKSDRTNNSEMIEIESAAAGRYEVIVKGVNVPQGRNGKQPFALLVSAE